MSQWPIEDYCIKCRLRSVLHHTKLCFLFYLINWIRNW